MSIYMLFLACLVLLSAFSQVLLKKAALMRYGSFFKYFFSAKVLVAYFVFVTCIFMNIWMLKYLELSTVAVIESLGYIYILILNRIFFNERITFYKITAVILILIGVILVVI